MLIYTPKVGRLLALDAFVDDAELPSFKGRLMHHVLERAGEDVIRHIVNDCTKTTPNKAMRGTDVSVRVVVMSESELKEALDDAYKQGSLRGAR